MASSVGRSDLVDVEDNGVEEEGRSEWASESSGERRVRRSCWVAWRAEGSVGDLWRAVREVEEWGQLRNRGR